MNFVDAISEKTKPNWAEIYKKYKHKKWVPPVKDKRGIQCETKIEDTQEISHLMQEKPGYSVDVQGREG